MDGTLLDSQKEIPAENIKAIQEAAAAGIKIVLCTGRPRSGILPHFEKLGLSEEEYIIMNNGLLMKLKIGSCCNMKVYLALRWKNSCRLAKTFQRWL